MTSHDISAKTDQIKITVFGFVDTVELWVGLLTNTWPPSSKSSSKKYWLMKPLFESNPINMN